MRGAEQWVVMDPRWHTLPDYNRGLWLPLRWLSRAWVGLCLILEPLTIWVNAPKRRDWARPVVVGGLIAFLLLWLGLDRVLAPSEDWAGLGGDIKREWNAWQQYGALTSVVVIAIVIWLLDRAKRTTLADLGLAWLLVGGAASLLKPLIGRARPKYADPEAFVGPFGAFPVTRHGEGQVMSSWEAGYELASMPSSHTAAAVALSVYLAMTYPRLRLLAIFLAGMVALGRVWSGAHWPADVVVGASLAMAIAVPAVRGRWGRRLLRMEQPAAAEGGAGKPGELAVREGAARPEPVAG